ncbi:RES family NAD+ phosphorylase [Ahrensia sp. R2A130]|uniref:RES family NAD+ phosphorylase n=1 Tax=Ahrensia sp. R2A130 TaxID=744979 RepID=UPI00058F0D04|nr:RES family NAD+ phosphorylase [Ahrensia sp. R2A130]
MNASDLAVITGARRRAVADLFAGMMVTRPLNNFVRVTPTARAATPFGYGASTSRFSPLRASLTPTPPFGVIYGAMELATACYEAIIRDSFDIQANRVLRKKTYNTQSAVNFSTAPGQALNLLDLTGGAAAKHGVPMDVIRYSDHEAGQYFSELVHSGLVDIDGLLYASRFTEGLCVVVYNRGIAKLVSPNPAVALKKSLLAPTMAPWNIATR